MFLFHHSYRTDEPEHGIDDMTYSALVCRERTDGATGINSVRIFGLRLCTPVNDHRGFVSSVP